MWILGIVTVGIGASAVAASIDVTCRAEDCLRHGWTAYDRSSGFWADTVCVQNDCQTHGWRVRDQRNNVIVAECLAGGCFLNGWVETWVNTGARQIYLCSGDGGAGAPGPAPAPDCLRFGWSANGPHVRGTTTCRGQDCRTQGWTVYGPGLPDRVALCKNGPAGTECFRYGWTLFQ